MGDSHRLVMKARRIVVACTQQEVAWAVEWDWAMYHEPCVIGSVHIMCLVHGQLVRNYEFGISL